MISYFLRFFVAFCTVLGRFYKLGIEIAQHLPSSIYKAKMLVDAPHFQRFVVCRRCHTVYFFEDCFEGVAINRRSKTCCFQRFPFHPHCHMRKPCETLLLRSVELANGHLHLHPFFTYCYLSLEVSLQSLLLRPTFFEACEQWRTRKTTEDEMKDVYDGNVWSQFNDFMDTHSCLKQVTYLLY